MLLYSKIFITSLEEMSKVRKTELYVMLIRFTELLYVQCKKNKINAETESIGTSIKF